MKKYRIAIEGIDQNINMVQCKTLLTDNNSEGYELVKDWIINRNHDNVNMKISFWDEKTQDWYEDSNITFLQPDTESEFYIIENGAHECRLKHSYMQELVLHAPTRTLFIIDERSTTYLEDTKEDSEVFFYKFKYTTAIGKQYQFTAYCNLRGMNKTPEELSGVKENILRPGAKWFCNHIRERYRCFFQDDACSKITRKQNELNNQ